MAIWLGVLCGDCYVVLFRVIVLYCIALCCVVLCCVFCIVTSINTYSNTKLEWRVIQLQSSWCERQKMAMTRQTNIIVTHSKCNIVLCILEKESLSTIVYHVRVYAHCLTEDYYSYE